MSFVAEGDSGPASRLARALRKPALGLKRAVALAAFLSGWLMLVVVAPLVLVAEIVGWLQSGAWPGWSFGDALVYARIGTPHVTWVGLQSLFDLVMSIPGSVGIFAAGLAIVVPVMKSWDREADAEKLVADQTGP
jgi:hypothetical protein